jgi:hypothetical protein
VSLNIHMLCAIVRPSFARFKALEGPTSIIGGAFHVGYLFDGVTLEQVFRRELPFPLISYSTHAPYSSVI